MKECTKESTNELCGKNKKRTKKLGNNVQNKGSKELPKN